MTKRANRGLRGGVLGRHRYALIFLGIHMHRAWREARALFIGCERHFATKGPSQCLWPRIHRPPRAVIKVRFGLKSIVISRLILGVERGLEEAE